MIEIQPGQLITGAGSAEPAIARRPRRRRPGARPGQDRRDRAPPRDGPRGPRARARLRAARGRVRLDRRPRRAQPRRRGRRRRRHGAVRGARAGARRRARGGARRRGPRRARAARSPGCSPTRRSRRSPRGSSTCRTCCVEQGVEIGAPFMTLSFLALSVIPSLKITDRGLVDVDAFGSCRWRSNGRIVLEREAFVARFGALYEHSPWVAETRVAAEGFERHRGARRARCGRRCTRRPRTSQLALIRAHPGPRREGRRAHRALAARAGRARPRPALPRRVRALHGHQRRLPREVRDPVRGLRARAHARTRSWPTRTRGWATRASRRSRRRWARSPRSPGCGWRMRCEPLHARAGHGAAGARRRASRSSCAREGAVVAAVETDEDGRAAFGDVGGRRVRAGLRRRRLLRRARSSWTGSRSVSGSPTRREIPRAAARLALGVQHL